MNEEDIGIYVLLSLLIIPLLLLVDWAYIQPQAEANAMQLCTIKGYETFVTYNRKFLGTTPYALVCGTLKERMIYEGKIKSYNLNGNNQTMIITDYNFNQNKK